MSHAAAIVDLEQEIGAAFRLALENERLQVEVLAQLHDLRVSRTRIVEKGASHAEGRNQRKQGRDRHMESPRRRAEKRVAPPAAFT